MTKIELFYAINTKKDIHSRIVMVRIVTTFFKCQIQPRIRNNTPAASVYENKRVMDKTDNLRST